MNKITVTGTWTDANDDRREYATTSDPRVLAVIERDMDDRNPINGDVYAPAAWITYRNGYVWEKAADTFEDDAAMNVYVAALDHYGSGDPRVARYMLAFHGTVVRKVEVYRGDIVAILNTPAWREHVGLEATAVDADVLDGDVQTWRAVRDGEVYGVGYATRETHVLNDGEPIDLSDWDVEMTCWGMIGHNYARESAARFDYGTPDLPALLPL